MGTSASMGLLGLLLLLVVMIIPIVGGIMLIVMGRKRGQGFPACGQCGYDVSGTLGTTNARCPECGSDFGIVGISPSVSRSNKGAMIAGIALIALPLMCFGGMMLTSYTAMTRARTAVQQARTAAAAAQQMATINASQQSLNAQFLEHPPSDELMSVWRERLKNRSRQMVDDRVMAIWLDLGSDAAAQPETLSQLRAELQALAERAVENAPQQVRDYIATPMTQEMIDDMTSEQLREALATNAVARQHTQRYPALNVRVTAEFNALLAASRGATPSDAAGTP